MKAKARKILALIMAMVMCLSLAAPALAAYDYTEVAGKAGKYATDSDTPDLSASLFATSTSFEGYMATESVYHVVASTENNGDYTVYGVKQGSTYTAGSDNKIEEEEICSGNVTAATQPNGVKVEVKTQGTHLIGKYSEPTFYTVKYADAEGTVQKGVPGSVTKTLQDVTDAEWKKLENSNATFPKNATTSYQVQGYAYTETIPTTGKVNVYFKLAKVESGSFQSDVLYFVAKDQSVSVKMSDALAVATGCTVYGVADTSITVTGNAAIEVATAVDVNPAYAFVTMNTVDINRINYTADTTDSARKPVGGKFTSFTFATDSTTGKPKTSGSFQVSIEDKAQEYKNKQANPNDSTKVYVTDVAAAKAILVDALAGIVTVDDVTAAGGNFLTVAVTAVANAEAYDSADYSKNILTYNGKAGLIDLSQDGWYNGTNAEGLKGTQIAAGTEFLGPVVVKKSDVANYTVTGAASDDGTFVVFNSVSDMKAGITATSCKDAKTITYAQAIMNYKVGGKANILLTATATNLDNAVTKADQHGNKVKVDLNSDWTTKAFTTPAAAFVKTGTFDVSSKSHTGTLVDTVETKASTCKEAGSKTTKTVCSDCNKVVAEKTEALPVVSDPVKTNTTKVKDENNKDVDKIVFDTTQNNPHYIAKAETTTTVNEKKQTVVTTVYTCNLGVVHDELTRTTIVEKASLQASGKWNLATWGENYNILHTTVSNAFFADETNMFGNTIEIADSDVDYENLPLNRTVATSPTGSADPVFKFDADSGYGTFYDMGDGTYTSIKSATANIYASNKSLPTQKTFVAIATEKNINFAKFTCLTGSASLQVDVYEQTEKWTASDDITTSSGKLDTEKLAKALADGKMTKLQTYTKDVVIPASSNHIYTSGATVCDRCGTSRESAQTKSQIFTADTITVSNVTYTGKPVLPNVVVKDSEGNMLIKGIDYEVGFENENATAVGEYTVVIKGIGDFVGNRISMTYKIVAASTTAKKQSLKVNTKKKTFKVKNLKKKKASFKVKLSGAKTAVTWKSNNAKVTVKGSKTKATITVKKGTKKGTYKVTATAKKTSAYKKGTVTIKVVVK